MMLIFVNDYALSQVVLGGGQDASAVTTTDHRAGKFEAKFYDKVSVTIRGLLENL